MFPLENHPDTFSETGGALIMTTLIHSLVFSFDVVQPAGHLQCQILNWYHLFVSMISDLYLLPLLLEKYRQQNLFSNCHSVAGASCCHA